jgi:hypothetical protein
MPYLHWDLEHLRLQRENIIKAPEARSLNQRWSPDQKLLYGYLNDDHPIHIRRTLAQYYYHTLRDTAERDKSQVVTRYQTNEGLQPKVITMVDQLWLWVLNGEDGQPESVITCFPQIGESGDPDRYRQTDVFGSIKHYLEDVPSSVQTAYDLACLIAAKCSRIYLDTRSTLNFKNQNNVRFSEIYETAIGNVVRTITHFLR